MMSSWKQRYASDHIHCDDVFAGKKCTNSVQIYRSRGEPIYHSRGESVGNFDGWRTLSDIEEGNDEHYCPTHAPLIEATLSPYQKKNWGSYR